VPTYASASGKVHLAYMDEDSVRAMFSDGLSKVTDTTIVSMEGLLKELNNVRKLGYAIDNEEFETEVISFSAPVLNFLGKVVAALSVSTPKIRVNNNRIENEIVPTIKKEANKLSEKYGYKLS
jgi:DNA-binding IclR family transcriptional regulator